MKEHLDENTIAFRPLKPREIDMQKIEVCVISGETIAKINKRCEELAEYEKAGSALSVQKAGTMICG